MARCPTTSELDGVERENRALRERCARLEEELERATRSQSEAALEQLLEESVLPIAILTRGRVAFANPALCALSGYTREQLLALSPDAIRDVVDAADRDEIWERLQRQLGGEPVEEGAPFRFQRPDGTQRWAFVRTRHLQYGGEAAIQAVYTDVTEQRRTLEAYRSLVDHSLQGHAILQDLRITFANRALSEIIGLELPALRALSSEEIFDMVHPEDRDHIRAATLAAARGDEYGKHYLFRFRRPDGSERWIETTAVLVDHDNGSAVQIAVNDVTERHRMEAALRRSERLLRSIVDHSGAVIYVKDRAGRYLVTNERQAKRLGVSIEAILGKTDADLYPRAVAERFTRNDRQVLDEGRPIQFEEQVDGCGPSRTNLSIKFPIADESGAVYAVGGISTDITERLRAQEERRRLEAKVQHAQKLESLGVLAGGIAHDFNNLLLAILGNAGLAQAELGEPSPARSHLADIEQAAQRASELCRQLLAYSGHGKFVTEPVDVNRLVAELAQLLEVSISKKASLRLRLAQTVPPITADPSQITQVVMNLITNASDALGDTAGEIVISTGTLDFPPEGPGWLGEPGPGRAVYVQVADTGAGMSPSVRERLFDPFFTTKFTGRGLGMAAVLGIVRGHDGAIQVQTESGRGSALTVAFPAAETRAAAAERVRSAGGAWQGEGTVLVVDDEEIVRNLVRKSLEAAGLNVQTAADGREAVETFEAHADEIALVVLDMTMPELSGEETLAELRRVRPDVPALLTSGFSAEDFDTSSDPSGPTAFIQKPYRPGELLTRVREMLAGEGQARPLRSF